MRTGDSSSTSSNGPDKLAEPQTASGAIGAALAGRRSIRAFLPTTVSREVIGRILDVSRRAPSASNMQPWKAHVLTGAARDRLSAALLEAHDAGVPAQREYDYYPQTWREPYLARRRAVGWQLYEAIGIGKGDRAASKRHHGRNYQFFGAPVGLIFSLDKDLGRGSLIDFGMFLQSIMIAARGEGLETCPQAALANYPHIVRQQLGIPDSEMILCGMSLGYADLSAPENSFTADREPVENFTRFHME